MAERPYLNYPYTSLERIQNLEAIVVDLERQLLATVKLVTKLTEFVESIAHSHPREEQS